MTQDPTPNDSPRGEEQGQGSSSFSFTDKRKVDPADGSVRPSGGPAAAGEPAGDAPSEPVDPIDAEAAKLFEQETARGEGEAEAPSGASSDEVAQLRRQLADKDEELKRAQAEYVNSRRRIENAAQVGKQEAVGRVLVSLIGVLDDIELGRQHGDIAEGTPFQSIAAKLEDALRVHGMERFGAVGEEFDPNLHEALMHEDSDEVQVNTVKTVLQPGYRMNDRILRPARVATYGPQ